MAKPTRWVRLSVDIFDDDKVIQLDYAAQVLYLKLILWAAKHQTDGWIPGSAVRTISGYRYRNLSNVLARMVDLGLLANVPLSQGCDVTNPKLTTDYSIVAFSKWQMVTDNERPGQRASGDGPSRAGTGSGTRTEQTKSINSKEAGYATGPRRLVNGHWMRHFPGTGWVLDDSATDEQRG